MVSLRNCDRKTPDTSKYIAFEWHQSAYYYDTTNFPEERNIIGRLLGVARNVGQPMRFWILAKSGRVIARSTVQSIPVSDLQMNEVKHELKQFDDAIR